MFSANRITLLQDKIRKKYQAAVKEYDILKELLEKNKAEVKIAGRNANRFYKAYEEFIKYLYTLNIIPENFNCNVKTQVDLTRQIRDFNTPSFDNVKPDTLLLKLEQDKVTFENAKDAALLYFERFEGHQQTSHVSPPTFN